MDQRFTKPTSHTPFADLDALLTESDHEHEPLHDEQPLENGEGESSINEQILAALVSP
jgi:hypothetical protein